MSFGWVSIIPSKKIPAVFFLDRIHDTEYGIPAEFRKNPYRRNTEFRMLRNSVKYGIPHIRNSAYIQNSVKNTEFRNLIPAEFREKIPKIPAEFRNTEFRWTL